MNKKGPERAEAKGCMSACQKGWPPPRKTTTELTGGKPLSGLVAKVVATINLSIEDVRPDIALRYLAVGEAFNLDRSSDWNLVVSEPLVHRLWSDIHCFG